MKSKGICLGMLAMVLVLGMTVVQCDLFEDPDFTFEFKVKNVQQGVITEIQFLNGDNPGAPVLQTETVYLAPGDITGVYKISGFTDKYTGIWVSDPENYRNCAIRIIYEDGNRGGGVHYAKNKSKILAEGSNLFIPPMVFFKPGNW
jgi:hypothetical protein